MSDLLTWTKHAPYYITWYMTDGRVLNVCDYGQDVGSLHVIDYRLWLADLPIRRPFAEAPRALRFSPADWSR